MSWIYLLGAIILEVSGTVCMKLSEGFTKWIPGVSMFILYGLSLASLTFALKQIDVGVAYAIWAGIGTALIATVGILWFQEPATALKIVSVGLIIIGVAGLHISGGMH